MPLVASPWIYLLIGALAVGFISSVYLLIFQRSRGDNPANSTLIAVNSPAVLVSPTADTQVSNENRQITQPLETGKTEQIKTEIAEKIRAWVNSGASRDINSTMAYYADTVDYYRKPGSSKSLVRNDKQNYYNKFQTASVSTSNLVVMPSFDGNSAEALFDKNWTYDGNSNFSGKVRQQLLFRRIGNMWLIVGERDIKVYYVNK